MEIQSAADTLQPFDRTCRRAQVESLRTNRQPNIHHNLPAAGCRLHAGAGARSIGHRVDIQFILLHAPCSMLYAKLNKYSNTYKLMSNGIVFA